MNENELRDLLRDRAKEIDLSDRIPQRVAGRARRRIALSGIAAGLTSLVLLLGGGLLVTSLGRFQPPRATEVPLAIDLTDYYQVGYHEQGDRPDDNASREEIEQHVACMRRAGFDLPDPTRTESGWAILVEDPEALGFETRAWREAAFVTCRPPPPPGPGDMVFGKSVMSEAEVEDFRSCMAAEGFELPAPRLSEGMWRFDTSNGGIDFGDEAWNRAVFVTCFPAAS
jgi:hypothetical protein